MISINNVTKCYHTFTALDQISVELPDTGFVALTGENGCGKTTLLNMISTVDKPDSGSIRYNDVEYTRRSRRFLRNEVLSFVQQDSLFADWLRIRENLMMTGADADEVNARLSQYGIADKTNQKPVNLSGGQRQKCGFIRGIMRNTPVLLVDEPTSSMDADAERASFDILKALSQNRLVLAVSHNRQLIDEYADMILMMENGKIVRTVDNQRGIGAMIEPDRILIPESQGYDISADWKKIRAELGRRRRVQMELYAAGETRNDRQEGQARNAIPPQSHAHSSAMSARNSMKSLKAQPVMFGLGCIFSAILVLLCALFLFIQTVDTNRFGFDLLTSNGYDEIVFSEIYADCGESIELVMPKDYYREFCDKYGISGKTFWDRDSCHASLNIESADEFLYEYMYPDFSRIVMLDFSHIEPSVLHCGRFPSYGEAVITDYMADQLINDGQFDNYEDIVENSIRIGGYPLTISGIMETNYRDFPSVYSIKIEPTELKAGLAAFKAENHYACLYLNQECYFDIQPTTIPFVFFDAGNLCADIVVLDPTSPYPSGSYRNTAAAAISKKSFLCSIFFNTNDVSDTVIDDGLSKPVLYITRDLFDKKVAPWKDNPCFEQVGFPLVSVEEYAELCDLNLYHYMPISDTLYSAVYAVETIKNSVVVLLCACFGAAVLFSFWMWAEAFKKQRYMIYTMIMYGYKPIHLLIYTGIRLCVKLILEAGLVIGGYCWASSAINSLISKASGYQVVLFTSDVKSALIAFGIYALGILIVVSVHLWIQTVRCPIKLYRKCGKN